MEASVEGRRIIPGGNEALVQPATSIITNGPCCYKSRSLPEATTRAQEKRDKNCALRG